MTISQGVGSSAASPIRLMTVDDHPIYRGGLASLIAAYRDLTLVAEAANGAKRSSDSVSTNPMSR